MQRTRARQSHLHTRSSGSIQSIIILCTPDTGGQTHIYRNRGHAHGCTVILPAPPAHQPPGTCSSKDLRYTRLSLRFCYRVLMLRLRSPSQGRLNSYLTIRTEDNTTPRTHICSESIIKRSFNHIRSGPAAISPPVCDTSIFAPAEQALLSTYPSSVPPSNPPQLIQLSRQPHPVIGYPNSYEIPMNMASVPATRALPTTTTNETLLAGLYAALVLMSVLLVGATEANTSLSLVVGETVVPPSVGDGDSLEQPQSTENSSSDTGTKPTVASPVKLPARLLW